MRGRNSSFIRVELRKSKCIVSFACNYIMTVEFLNQGACAFVIRHRAQRSNDRFRAGKEECSAEADEAFLANAPTSCEAAVEECELQV